MGSAGDYFWYLQGDFWDLLGMTSGICWRVVVGYAGDDFWDVLGNCSGI